MAGAAYRGVGIADCVHSGEQAAEVSSTTRSAEDNRVAIRTELLLKDERRPLYFTA